MGGGGEGGRELSPLNPPNPEGGGRCTLHTDCKLGHAAAARLHFSTNLQIFWPNVRMHFCTIGYFLHSFLTVNSIATLLLWRFLIVSGVVSNRWLIQKNLFMVMCF